MWLIRKIRINLEMAKCLKIFDHLIWKDPQLFLITQELTPQGQMKVSQSRQAYLRTLGGGWWKICVNKFLEVAISTECIIKQVKVGGKGKKTSLARSGNKKTRTKMVWKEVKV